MANSDSKGNEFLGLLDQNEQRIRSYIFALVPNYADAQEIAQQVRMLMWEQFDEFRSGQRFWSLGASHCLLSDFIIQNKNGPESRVLQSGIYRENL